MIKKERLMEEYANRVSIELNDKMRMSPVPCRIFSGNLEKVYFQKTYNVLLIAIFSESIPYIIFISVY